MIDWDALLLAPVMGVFGEGDPAIAATQPLFMPAIGMSFRLPDAVFDAEYQQIEIEGEMSATTTSRPVLGVRLARFAVPPAQNDRVYIPSVATVFVVKDVEHDGHGHAKLVLMRTVDAPPA